MLPDNLTQLQGLLFASLLAVLFGLEWLTPIRRRATDMRSRWLTNAGLYVVNTSLPAALLPASIVVFALEQSPRGLAAWELSPWLAIGATALILDSWRYWEHRLLHQLSPLWCAHLVHHSDTRLDVTTSQRHHPLEVLLTLAFSMALIVLLGLPGEGVAIYYFVAMAVSLLTHANIDLPMPADRVLRSVVVTPAVHAIHHSDLVVETNSNYGAVLTLWDRLFGTYTRPDSTRQIRFGLEYFRERHDRDLWPTLLQPFNYRRPSATPLVYGVAGLAMVTLAMWPTVAGMIRIWRLQPEWQYAFLVLPMFIFLAGWEYRREFLQETLKPGLEGLLLAVPGCAIILFSHIVNIDFGEQLGLVIMYQAIMLATLGLRVYLKYLPLCALLFLMVPYGDVAKPVLRSATFWSVQVFTDLVGLPFSPDGFAFHVGDKRYVIVPACSGMIYFTLATFLGYSLGLMIYRRMMPILALTVVSGLVAVIANFFRVNAIIVADWINGTQADLSSHATFHWMAFALVFIAVFLLLRRLGAARPTIIIASRMGEADTGRSWAPLVPAALCLAVVAMLALNNNTVQQSVDDFAAFTPPPELGGFEAQHASGHWVVREDRGIAYTGIAYSNGLSGFQAIAVIPLANNIKLNTAQIKPDEYREWTRGNLDLRDACYLSQCVSYVHNTWKLDNTDEVYNVYASFVIGESLTASKFAVRLSRGLDKLRGRADRVSLIALSSDDPIRDPRQVAARLIQLKSGLSPASGGLPLPVFQHAMVSTTLGKD